MVGGYISLFLLISAILCTKNPAKTKKWYKNDLLSIIRNEIYKQYRENTTIYDKICSYEYLLLENHKYFESEATDEILKFILAKKTEEFHIIFALIKSNKISSGFVFHVSIAIFDNFCIGIKFMNAYYEIPIKSIFSNIHSPSINSHIKEYYIQKHISKFIFHQIVIFKRFINKIMSNRKNIFSVPIFSDTILFKNTDHDFISRILLRQEYIYENDYYLLINNLKINRKHNEFNETDKLNNILKYSFTNTIFKSIRNISFKRVEISDISKKYLPHKNYKNQIIAKEIYICNQIKYLNIYDIFLSNFQDDYEIEDRNNEYINILGYGSANIDIVTFSKIDKPEKIKKSLQEYCYLIIRDRQINLEYHFEFTYKRYNNELIDISLNLSIPSFSADITLKNKISFILNFVKEYRKSNFSLVIWDQTESILL
ncbi:hypothetical protein CWI37_0736p0010 [Hamiltosporidium tvaerminnensis]|uniref:Uncharacterized protein n=1 Tax=Hamiltosporidium tvaerminnensis TaxID=1176355 RepID=A0A4Q9L2T5_9MICR|nr:hypothetical protein CWI37_0736p0010 [Hamiltosporidium tvaerminnensis]